MSPATFPEEQLVVAQPVDGKYQVPTVESTGFGSLGLPGVYLEYLESTGHEKPRILPSMEAYVAVTVKVYQLHSAALEKSRC